MQKCPIADNAEQITVTIDRSYSAVPVEDLQLKGVVSKGKANILLPEFDKTDFFTHVPGYSWGFTSDPNGKKIEYYGGQAYDFNKDTKLYRVLVKYGGGSGTKDDPYLIDYFDQLELMSEEKARGYFRQTADISFPVWATHSPIRTVNELKADPNSEHFEYDGSGKRGHLITNSVSHADFRVIGQKTRSTFDDTVRQAPSYAYYQESILTVLNKNTVNPLNPKEIYTGSFIFGENGVFGDETGSLAYPEKISDLLVTTITEGNDE